MKDVGARGRTEGDSGEKAGKWVRGEDDDVEEKEEESDEARWRERYQREKQERDHNGSLEGSVARCRTPNNKPKSMNLCRASGHTVHVSKLVTGTTWTS
ncbi:hypothetical protein ABVT39_012756 [Epinephelus coioides]